ncbi:hypothetical protein E4U42_004469 [Claviceps africana]|uniref:5'-3' DNA helicase ZGRF1-like N-terminal domain-containing protein n=1 Tax=Claviceps africana TaxID=83212 RepID=A0A8K0J5M4_9HYPO|nr:hypothetical protein E4U42_004469 [Claviceps africana]
MSHPVRRTTSSAAPASSGEMHPTTATVLDYNCLFTHDLKRKQKRWQDGKLKYHTFNKKIMVYDDRGNFIGDAHWQAGGDLYEDEELDLDRGAAIVQVADFIGSREQDLTDVLDKRAREVEKRRAVAAAKTPASSRAQARPPAAAVETTHFQRNHRPLASIVLSPGPLGRASIPNQSPYEARQSENLGAPQKQAAPSARKRRRSPSPPSRAGFARSLFGAALSLSSSVGGSANRRPWALKERAVNAQEALGGETSDDDVVVVAQRPRMKGSLPQPRLLEGTAFKRPLEAPRKGAVSGEGDGPSKSPHVRGQLLSRHRHEIDSSPTRPGRRSDLLGGESRGARPQTMQDELVEQRDGKRSDVVRSATESNRPQRQTISRPFMDATRAPREERRSTSTSDEGDDRTKADDSPRLAATTHRQQHGTLATQKAAHSKLSDMAHPKPQEQRTELRIRSRRRRGLLMVAEMRQGRHAQQSSAFTEPDVQSMDAHGSAAGRNPRKPLPDAGDTTKLDECTIQATPEHTSKSTSASEAESVGDASCDALASKMPTDQPADEHVFFDPVDVSGARDKRSECPEETVDDAAEPPRQRRQWSLENMSAGAFVEPRKLFDAADMDDVESHISLDSEKTPAASPGKEKNEAVPLREERTETTQVVAVEDETPQQERSELTGTIGAQTSRRTAKSEASPANITPDEESDVPTARRRRRLENRIEPPPSSEEMPACHAPTRRRSSKMMRDSPADTAVDEPGGESDRHPRQRRPATQSDGHSESDNDAARDSNKGESDCASRKRPKRKRSKKDGDVAAAHQTAKPDGLRIKRLARKSVKSKEIFGFVASVEAGPMTASPFSMTAGCIGVVGRPPAAPKRLPGICLTMKPGLRSHDDDAIERPGADKGGQTLPGGQHGHDMAAQRVSDEADGAATTSRPVTDQGADGLPVPKVNAPKDGLVPRAKIVNPATRGKKAARKTDAAGRAPQHVVPFEPPQPARSVPKHGPPGPSGPNARDAALPGFSTAKGGAWSAHAEDLLGMTRPVGRGRR